MAHASCHIMFSWTEHHVNALFALALTFCFAGHVAWLVWICTYDEHEMRSLDRYI